MAVSLTHIVLVMVKVGDALVVHGPQLLRRQLGLLVPRQRGTASAAAVARVQRDAPLRHRRLPGRRRHRVLRWRLFNIPNSDLDLRLK